MLCRSVWSTTLGGHTYAKLLDQGTHLCSIRTMDRVLNANQKVRERRNQLQHPAAEVIRKTLIKECIGRDQLKIRSDRCAAMRSQAVAQLLATLGPTRVPQQTARQRRQPLLREPVQDAEVPARLPRPLHQPLSTDSTSAASSSASTAHPFGHLVSLIRRERWTPVRFWRNVV